MIRLRYDYKPYSKALTPFHIQKHQTLKHYCLDNDMNDWGQCPNKRNNVGQPSEFQFSIKKANDRILFNFRI